ncbi:MAG: IS66 family transposase [Planctomycetes bacterium]|nr:IS66 family transposase [Planctomycetota bacterium]
MRKTATRSDALDRLLAALQSGVCDRAAARRLYTLGPDAVTLALLAAARRINEQNARLTLLETLTATAGISPATAGVSPATAGVSPATPSGMRPVYTKPNVPPGQTTSGRRRKRPGARDGHPGHRRPPPTRIDQRQTHRLKVCPCCSGPLQRCRRTRTRLIEDLPENLRAQVTEHTIHRDYCPACKKHVEPVVPDALPNATFGHRIISFTSWCHYGLGVTIDQLVDILQYHLQTKLSAGGLIASWRRLADVLTPWYQQIAEQAKASAHLHADETGWRVQGRTCWLWCFTNHHNCCYLIDRNRGSPVLQRFFGDAFDGILLHDFWTAYESLDVADRQYCLVHLLRELEKVDQHNSAPTWQAFAKLLRRLLRDGIRLRKRADFTPQKYQRRILRLGRRLDALIATEPDDADARRLLKRLRRTGDHLFTFLDYPQIPFENNFAERMIRPAVILRKHSQSNRSDRGALTQAVLMSVYRTLKLRHHDPLGVIADALRTYLQTNQLPPLPATIPADG